MNRKNIVYIFLLVFSLFHFTAHAFMAEPEEKPGWQAKWISYPGINGKEAGVYHFRKQLQLKTNPESFVIHVSGDSRYRLFVNGHLVSFGPAKSDITHWKYETVDIAKFLKPGKNIISSIVWNFGDLNPISVFSLRTAFIIQGDTEKEKMINTDTTWKCFKNTAYQAIKITDEMVNGYYAAIPGEVFYAGKYPWNWKKNEFDDSKWINAEIVSRADLRSDRWTGIWPAMWMLEESNLPPMELKE